MSRPDSQPKGISLIDSKKLAAVNTALIVSGIASAVFGGYRTQQEYSSDQQKIGEITRTLKVSETLSPPPEEDLEAANNYFQDLAGGIDNDSPNNELYVLTQKIFAETKSIDSNGDFERYSGIISKQENYEVAHDAMVKEAGANDLEDANVWTLGAGAGMAVVGLAGLSFVGGANAGAEIQRRKGKVQHTEVSYDE